jgi:lipoprotein-releasing system permease protein
LQGSETVLITAFFMSTTFESFIALRYVRARRRNHFISFISMTSMIGVALGVMALIAVLSVMNGFDKELTQRILGMASHATVVNVDGSIQDWRTLAEIVKHHPQVEGVAPYSEGQGMAVQGKRVQGTLIRGILPDEEPRVSVVAEKMVAGKFSDLRPGEFDVIIGTELSRLLGVLVGDKITLVAPEATVTAAGILPRLKRFNVVGIFEIGMHEFDSALVLTHLDDANRFFRESGPAGLRLKTSDVMQAPYISREIAAQLPGRFGVIDWTQRHSNFFKALKTEKTVMFVILTLIVAVAAFNIISTLVMTVTDKESDIAVLRTLGAGPRSILAIFMIQGTVIGTIGILLGVIAGVALALNVETIVPAIETLFKMKFLSPDVYYISDLPSDLRWGNVVVIVLVAFAFCVTATIYPAWRAARIQPAEALRYE